jgi:hypothetical protein
VSSDVGKWVRKASTPPTSGRRKSTNGIDSVRERAGRALRCMKRKFQLAEQVREATEPSHSELPSAFEASRRPTCIGVRWDASSNLRVAHFR